MRPVELFLSQVQDPAARSAFLDIMKASHDSEFGPLGITSSTGSGAVVLATAPTLNSPIIKGFVGLGTETNPQAPLVISQNAATGLPPVATVTFLMIQAQDHTDPYVQIDAFGGGGGNHAAGAIVFRTTGGTGASPNTQVVVNTPMGGIGVRPNTGAGYAVTNTSRINWSYMDPNPGMNGTRMEFDTTPINSTTRATAFFAHPSGGVSIGPVPVDPGISSLLIDANAASSLPAFVANAQLVIAGQDNQNPILEIDAFGNGINAAGALVFRASRGTGASPNVSLNAGDVIGAFGARPNTGSGYAITNTSRVVFVYTDTNAGQNGSAIEFDTTPNNSTTRALAAYIFASGGFAVGSNATDPGTGSILFTAQLYGPNIATTASAANAFIDTGSSPAGQIKRSTSSARYKDQIEALSDDAADRLLRMRPVRYRSKAAGDRPDWSWYGLIAEEVAEIEPRLVHYDQDGRPDGVMYDRLGVLLLNVVRRQSERIGRLENTLH